VTKMSQTQEWQNRRGVWEAEYCLLPDSRQAGSTILFLAFAAAARCGCRKEEAMRTKVSEGLEREGGGEYW